MLHNKASEGLIKPDRLGYDLYSGIADTKALFLKYCKPFEKRIRSLVPTHRVVPAGDGEASTTVSVTGFLVDAKAKKKAPQQVELQFLEHHKTLYLDLHREFTKSEYAPQSEASLKNFKTLLLLEIAILLGCDLEWATGSSVGAAVADPPVLAAGAAADDDDAPLHDKAAGYRQWGFRCLARFSLVCSCIAPVLRFCYDRHWIQVLQVSPRLNLKKVRPRLNLGNLR